MCISNRLIKDPRKEIKIKEANQMNHIVTVVTNQIHEMKAIQANQFEELSDSVDSISDKNTALKNRLLQLLAVMQQGGQFKGFNRKIQIRTLKWGQNGDSWCQCDTKPEIYAPSTPSPVLKPASNDVFNSRKPIPFMSLNSSDPGSFELRHGVERVYFICHFH